jgi:histidine ammonia-lyase
MEQARAEFLELVDANPSRHIYGVTTAHHYSACSILSPEHRAEYARHIPPYTIGGERALRDQPPPKIDWPRDAPRLPERVSRGIVLARLSSFIEGHAAVRPQLAREVAALLSNDLPLVPVNRPSAFAASYLFRGFDGKLELKEGMALLNGAPTQAAYMADVALAARGRLPVIEEVCALASEAILAPHEHWAEALTEIWDDPDESAALERMRALLTGGAHVQRRPYQAPVSFRIIPKMIAQVRRALRAAEYAAEVSLKAVGDNPIFLPTTPARSKPDVITNASFHNGMAPPAIDAVSFAWTDLTQLVNQLATRLATDPDGIVRTEPQAQFSLYYWYTEIWAEEARARATPTFISLGGVAPSDVSDVSAASWRKADFIGSCLDESLAALAALARRTIMATGREVPPSLEPLAAIIDSVFPLNMPIAAQHPPALRELAKLFTTRALRKPR